MVEQHLPPERAADRQFETLRKLPDTGNRFFVPARAAENDHRPLCSRKALAEIGKLVAARMSGNRGIGQRLRRLDLIAQHVFGQGQHHGTGATRCCHSKGAGDEFRDTGGIVDLADPFCEFGKSAPEFHFLKGFALAGIALDLADEQDHRDRILPGYVKAGGGVCGARAAGDQADARFAGQSTPGIRHHCRPAFLAANEHVDIAVMQGIEHGEKALARHAGNALHTIGLQRLDDELPARSLHVPAFPSSSANSARTSS